RMMREGLDSEEVDLGSDKPGFIVVVAQRQDMTPIQNPESDLNSSAEGFALTMAEALSPGVSDGRGCEEELGPSMGSSTLPDGDGLELMVDNSPEHSSVVVVSVGSPEMKDVDGEKLLEGDATEV
ncbi:hypothetical protein Dimus_010712, partial [Dionaea muscipula]